MQNSELSHRVEFKKAGFRNGYSLSNFADTEIKAMRSSLRASWFALYAASDMLDLAPLNLHISVWHKAQTILAETRILKLLGYIMQILKKHLPHLSVILIVSTLLSGCVTSSYKNDPCGLVSTYLEPTKAENLYRAVVTNLDGKSVISQPNYQLQPGQHVLTLVELIDAPELNVPLSERTSKQLEIMVKPNTRYHIAAKYLPLEQGENFWQPVVWQHDKASCQFIRPEVEE